MFQQIRHDRAFYRRVISIALPIIIQNGVTNFVSMLDNVMVGQIGTVQMSGVSIVNQLMFVFNLCVFGASSGAGIFTAQFHGSRDTRGVRYTFRFKLCAALALTALGIGVFLLGGTGLIGLYLRGEGSAEDAAQTLSYGLRYLQVMLFGLLPFALTNAYASTLRETGQTTVPMVAGVSAVLVNLVLNYTLIFGHFGAPELGVVGAALATVISRYVELAIVALWTHTHGDANPFIRGAFRGLGMPIQLARRIAVKGMPLLANEALWSIGMAMLNQCYSTRGLDVVAATNISGTMFNLSSVVFLSMGNAVGIIMGQMLGAGVGHDEIRAANRKCMALSVVSCLLFAGLMAGFSGIFPHAYNTTDSVRSLATGLICISALFMPFNSYTNAAYFTLRSGGQTFVTFLFDSAFIWSCCVPVAFCLSRFTGLSILTIYFCVQALDLIKCAIGAWMLRKGVWIRRIVT